MAKQFIIDLFESKDKGRRRCLYDTFKDTINLNASLKFIAKMINKELARDDLITVLDIKYCRHYFAKKAVRKPLPALPKIQSIIPDNLIVNSKKITWTNPDEVNVSQQLKSKFSKQ